MHPIKEVIPGLLQKLGLESRLWEQALVNEWPVLVGEQVALHTRPGRIYHGVLHVFVKNSAWLNELSRYGRKEMLANLQRRFGTTRIRQIRLQIEPDRRQS